MRTVLARLNRVDYNPSLSSPLPTAPNTAVALGTLISRYRHDKFPDRALQVQRARLFYIMILIIHGRGGSERTGWVRAVGSNAWECLSSLPPFQCWALTFVHLVGVKYFRLKIY